MLLKYHAGFYVEYVFFEQCLSLSATEAAICPSQLHPLIDGPTFKVLDSAFSTSFASTSALDGAKSRLNLCNVSNCAWGATVGQEITVRLILQTQFTLVYPKPSCSEVVR